MPKKELERCSGLVAGQTNMVCLGGLVVGAHRPRWHNLAGPACAARCDPHIAHGQMIFGQQAQFLGDNAEHVILSLPDCSAQA